MQYPTMQQVEVADRYQLGKWWRFLPAPGENFLKDNGPNLDSLEHEHYTIAADNEERIMKRISERFKAMGMFTPEISKSIGWTPPTE